MRLVLAWTKTKELSAMRARETEDSSFEECTTRVAFFLCVQPSLNALNVSIGKKAFSSQYNEPAHWQTGLRRDVAEVGEIR